MPFLTVASDRKKYEFQPGLNLMELMLDNDLFLDSACAGKGICGKCRVRIIYGDAGPVTETEMQILTEEEIKQGIRLACLVLPDSDLSIELMKKEKKHSALTSGYMPDFEFDRDIVKLHESAPGDFTNVIYCNSVIAHEHGDTTGMLYGVAIDLGTTTVVCSLVDMNTGKEIGHTSDINAQAIYGLDVLTRITYEIEHPDDGIEKLRKSIVDSINSMVRTLCHKHNISQEQIYEFVVSANNTMLHMLMGVDARPIGIAPYIPLFTGSEDVSADSIGLIAAPGARLYCLPSVSAFIGADIVAGAYVCGLKSETGNVVFIDIGTNGEIVLASHGKLLSCSCAAGPALEGMNISSGMRAAEGAIEDILITENGLELSIIDDCEPAGICGSGILSATKELLRTGILRKTGAFVKAGTYKESDYRSRYICVDEKGRRSFQIVEPGLNREPLYITQSDIRQVQMAKGALLSGFTALMQCAGLETDDLDKVLIAGQFGAHLPEDSITGTGILPFELVEKIQYVGNTSMTGAYMALMSGKVKREMEKLAGEIEYIELGLIDNYERLLSECLEFPAIM